MRTGVVEAQHRRAADSARDANCEVLACWRCDGTLRLRGDALLCDKRHRYEAVNGVFDLWPQQHPLPHFDIFGTPYGVLYDMGVKERPLARLAARVGWGADVDAIFSLMDNGVKCAPGEVILDVPIGGGPSLRSAPGRMLGTFIGIDLSDRMLHRAAGVMRAEGLSRVLLARGDATRLPVIDESVNRILCFNGLHVMPDKERALSEFYRVLKPKGQVWGSVVVRDPDARLRRPWNQFSWWFFYPADEYELRLIATDVGFEWEQQRTGNLMTFRGRRPA